MFHHFCKSKAKERFQESQSCLMNFCDIDTIAGLIVI